MEPLRILVVDDDSDLRRFLQYILLSWGHQVLAAADGAEGWDILLKENINLVITDWLMPRLQGPELCRKIRAHDFGRYIYVIILTAKSQRQHLIEAIDSGADDFMPKPITDQNELKVRLLAGQRVLEFEARLHEKHRQLEEKHRELEEAMIIIQKDLAVAAEIQQSLLPEARVRIADIDFASSFIPCEVVAGDIYNFFEVAPGLVGFYLLDVAGHGVPAAMLSVSVGKIMNPYMFARPTRGTESRASLDFSNPAEIAANLNQLYLDTDDSSRYFTMIYGVIDRDARRIRFTQAGHPPPVLLRGGGQLEILGEGGFPIGLFEDVTFDNTELDFEPGDRLFIYSDGVTECVNRVNQPFSSQNLFQALCEFRHQPLTHFLGTMRTKLEDWRQNRAFQDDVSMVCIGLP